MAQRIARQRVFDIVVNGTKSWREPAGTRVAIEVQHDLVTNPERFKGCSVRVLEKYIGGARVPRLERESLETS